MARPSGHPLKRKSIVLHIRVTEIELAYLEFIATKAKITTSGLVRSLLMSRIIEEIT